MFSCSWFISGEITCGMFTPSHRRSHSSVGVLPLTRGRNVAGGSQAPGNSPFNKLQNVFIFVCRPPCPSDIPPKGGNPQRPGWSFCLLIDISVIG